MYVCVYIYIYIYIHKFMCIYIYIYIHRERERGRDMHMYVYIYICICIMYMYIYIYIYVYAPSKRRFRFAPRRRFSCLQTKGVDTNGAAGKVIKFDRSRKKVRPWHFWQNQSGLTGVTKQVTLSTTKTFAVTPLVLTPFVPFRSMLT